MQNTSNTAIKQFITKIADKNYNEANVALQRVIENKLKDRIKSSIKTKN